MATLSVTEFKSPVSPIGSALAQISPQPALAQQNIAISGSSAPSAGFSAQTYAVEIYTDTDCYFLFGTPGGSTPVATTANGALLLAGEPPRRYAVVPGQQVAAIT